MLALTPPPDRAVPVLWQNIIREFHVPGRLDSGHGPLRPLTLSGLCAVPATKTHAIARRGKVWPPAPGLEPGSHYRHQRRIPALISTRPRRGQMDDKLVKEKLMPGPARASVRPIAHGPARPMTNTDGNDGVLHHIPPVSS